MGRKVGEENCGEKSIIRKPFSDIKQNRDLSNKERPSRKTSLPQYLIKTETVGKKNCPVHGEEKLSAFGKSSGPLGAPSLIRRNSINLGRINTVKCNSNISNRRPKHSTNLPKNHIQDNTIVTTSEKDKFKRGPGQWSVRGTKMGTK